MTWVYSGQKSLMKNQIKYRNIGSISPTENPGRGALLYHPDVVLTNAKVDRY